MRSCLSCPFLMGLLLRFALLATVVSPLEAQIGPFDKRLERLVQPIRINGGTAYKMPMDVDGPGTLSGQVKAAGGSGHDIRIQVFFGDHLLLDSGQRHLTNIDLALSQPGRYWIVFDNSFSFITSKLVWHDLNVSLNRPAAPVSSSPSSVQKDPGEALSGPPRETLSEVISRLLEQPDAPPATGLSSPLVGDRWRGLELGTSSPMDALGSLGQPDSDKLDRLSILQFSDLIRSVQQEKVFRRLRFKDVEGFREVELSFWQDKLVVIDLRPLEGIPSANLPALYGIEFVAFNSDLLALDKYEAVEGSRYWLLATYEGHFMAASARAETGQTVEQGTADRIQLVSKLVVRPLDEPKGLDLLR